MDYSESEDQDTPEDQELVTIHSDALAEFDNIQSALRDERRQSLQDRRFYSIAGAQWEGDLGEQFENKPKFEVNKIHLAVIRIINEYRNNRITVDFISKEGDESDQLADTCDGLYRADEDDSVADEAYDNAFEEAVGGGFGAWRLRAEYEDEYDDEDERQRIRIEPIYDADSSVFFDLNAKRQDKSDAKRCFVLTSMSHPAYRDEYDDDPASWPKTIHQHEFDWLTPDVVYIAEYYQVECTKETVHVFETVDGEEERYTDSDFEADETLADMLDAVGSKEIRQKKVKRRKIHKYIMSGSGVLENCGYIAGTCIPIVPVYGKRWFIDNIERCMGHVRLAKDAQRIKNMQLSKLGEISALSSIEKPILTPEQIAGHAQMWADDNIKDFPYLLVNPITDKDGNEVATGPIGYTKPPAIPPAMAALLQITEQDMQDVLGNQQAGEQMQPNMSGKAVELIQNRLDMQTFIYMSNMAKAVKRSGEIWLSMAKDILVEPGRKMKTIGSQGELSSVELGKPILTEEGETEYENDLSKAKYDVTVDVGPSSSSKRAATVRSLIGMLQVSADPETQQVIGAMIMMNMEGEGIDDVRDYFRKKLIKLGVVQPTKQEAADLMEELQNTPPDANTQYLQSAAKNEEAKAENNVADTVLKTMKAAESKANAENTQADTVKKLSETRTENQDRIIQAAELTEQVTEDIADISPVIEPVE